MKDKTDDNLQLHQAFHGSFKHSSRLLSHTYTSSAHADHHNRDAHNEYLVDSADLLQPHVHRQSSTHHDGDAAPHCGPLSQAYSALDNHSIRRDDQDDAAAFRNDKLGQVSDDHLLQAFHESFDHRDVAAAPQYCSLLSQSLSAQARRSTKDDQDAAAAGDDDHARHSVRRQPRCNIQRQQASSTEAEHIKCADKKHSHADDQLHEALHGSSKIHSTLNGAEDDTAQRRRSSLAQAFSAEDYKDLLKLLSQSSSTKPAFSYSSSTLASEESHSRKVEFSSCRFNAMKSQSLASYNYNTTNKDSVFDDVAHLRNANRCSSSSFTRDDYTKKPYLHDKYYNIREPYNINHKICSTSYKYPMKEQYNSYIMRGVGLAFKWRPNISNFKLRSLFGGHLNKASSARVWVQEDEISCNMNPLHYEKPSYSSTSYQKSITGDYIISENSAKCSYTNGTSPKYSPINTCINGISTRNSPISSGDSSCNFITKFGSNLGSSLIPAYSYSGSTSSNSASSSTSACRSNTSGSLSISTSKDSHYISSSSFNYNHSSKLADINKPSQEPKLKRLQSLFHGKILNVQLFLGKSKLNHGQQSNSVNCRSPSFIDRSCNVSSFHEELPKDSIQGAIAHCKQSNMATINNSNGFVLP